MKVELNLTYSHYQLVINSELYNITIKQTKNPDEYKAIVCARKNYYDEVIIDRHGDYITGCGRLLRYILDNYILPTNYNKLGYKFTENKKYIKLLLEDK